jgi:hypothetical protein
MLGPSYIFHRALTIRVYTVATQSTLSEKVCGCEISLEGSGEAFLEGVLLYLWGGPSAGVLPVYSAGLGYVDEYKVGNQLYQVIV